MKNMIMRNKKIDVTISLLLAIALCLCTGCAAGQEHKYTREELNNLAEIRIYTVEDENLIKTVTDEEQLYQYNHCSMLEETEITEKQKELREALADAKEQYRLTAYKYPAARFGSKDLEEVMTLTLYEDENIIKMTVSDESIKAFSLPEEYLTFYYEASEEDMAFYRSLADE